MASVSLQRWREDRADQLDEIAAAHQSVGGTGRGRRYATEQINRAYAVLLSSQFQGYCRDLHSECADAILGHASVVALKGMLTPALTQGRMLDVRNPNPGTIGSDFNKFGLIFWEEVRNADPQAVTWQGRLELLNTWRNAIAHQDFRPAVLGPAALRLEQVRVWRRTCNRLAGVFDGVMKAHLFDLLGTHPW